MGGDETASEMSRKIENEGLHLWTGFFFFRKLNTYDICILPRFRLVSHIDKGVLFQCINQVDIDFT